jgi:DNA polymerase
VRELISMRLEASLTSGKKHQALLRGVSADGRLRGLLRFCGASRTGRWSGQLFQPQNLVRPAKYIKQDWDGCIEAIKSGAVEVLYDKPLEVISGTVRGALVAPPGRKLVIADLSNIEGRVLAWLAGEQWKLDAYAAGDDLYKLAYSRAFGCGVDAVTDDKRQIGKVMELALGYQGAVGAFSTMAAAFGVELPEAYVVQLVKAWRKANYQISTFWYEMEDAARRAVSNPGATVECRKLKLGYATGWLRIKLPSGRYLCYPHARIDAGGKLAYEGTNQYTRKWGKIQTYGGKLVENVTQAVARDVMAANMPAIEAAGFEIVLSVHDELVTESATGTAGQLSQLLAARPAWAPGLPLAAAGYETTRYRKD